MWANTAAHTLVIHPEEMTLREKKWKIKTVFYSVLSFCHTFRHRLLIMWSKEGHDRPFSITARAKSSSYLDHCDHALISNGVGADGEVSRGVPAHDAVDSVPVGAVGLITVYHCQVGHHHVHLVLWHFPRKLQGEGWRGRGYGRVRGGLGGTRKDGRERLQFGYGYSCTHSWLMCINK